MPLILVSAGPGTGKTVLLSESARGSQVPVAWLTLTPDDDNPPKFWRRLRAAIRASGAPNDAVDIGRPSTSLFDESYKEFTLPPTPIVIVVDDAHLLTNKAILDGLDGMVRSGEPRLRLVLAARSDPMLPLHRYRMAGQMFELRASDLAWTDAEAHALLEAHEVTLDPAAFEALMSRTEGWTAGLRLSAMRMEGADHPADFVAEFAVDQGSMGEYLTYEVLDRLPANARQMIIQTGFLDEVTGDLADAITGRDDGAETLFQLAHTNSFVLPLDGACTRYRYHTVLGEILRYLLQRQAGDHGRSCYRRAASWFEARREYQSAFHWAMRAGETGRAVSLLARGVIGDVVLRGDVAVRSDLGKLPLPTSHQSDPVRAAEATIARSAVVALTADSETAARELEVHQDELQTARVPDPDLQVSADLTTLLLGRKCGDERSAELAAEHVIAVGDALQNKQARNFRAHAMLARARAQFWDGRHDDVETQLATALALAENDRLGLAELDALGMLALVHQSWARSLSANDAAKRADELIRAGPPDLSPPVTLELAAAQRAYDVADFPAMAGALRRALALAPIEGDLALAAVTAHMRARLLLATDQVGAAKAVLEDAPRLRRGTAMINADRDILLADVEIALGRPHRALRLVNGHRDGVLEAETAVAAANAYVALGELSAAEHNVRKVVAGPTRQRSRGPLVEALLCDARIAQLRDDPTRAVESAGRAIEIADGAFVLPFVQQADVFAPLLVSHPLLAAQWPASARHTTNELPVEPGHGGTRPRLPEPLTEREQAVLRFLATTMSTAEIASELYLSVNTIKTHLGSIYRKLAAAKRRDAVLRARELELL